MPEATRLIIGRARTVLSSIHTLPASRALPYSILPPALFFTSLFQLQLYVDTWVRTESMSGLALGLQANVGPKTFAVCLIAACYANLSSGIIP